MPPERFRMRILTPHRKYKDTPICRCQDFHHQFHWSKYWRWEQIVAPSFYEVRVAELSVEVVYVLCLN